MLDFIRDECRQRVDPSRSGERPGRSAIGATLPFTVARTKVGFPPSADRGVQNFASRESATLLYGLSKIGARQSSASAGPSAHAHYGTPSDVVGCMALCR